MWSKHSERSRRSAVSAAALLLALPLGVMADGTETLPTPEWAVPKEGAEGKKLKGTVMLPGSDLALTQEQIDNPFETPVWYPDEHQPMPHIVRHGSQPDTWACAMCHLASGNGHPQSAKLAGNSTDYLLRQLEAFESGDRRSYLGAFIDDLHKVEDGAAARQAAEWFASLAPRSGQKVIESETVPVTTFDGMSFMRIVAGDDDGEVEHEPLGRRIIEVPEDYRPVKARSPHGTFLTYVPPGSIDAGRGIAMQGTGSVAACVTCHGPELKGTALGPALAGAFPTYIVRQLYDFRNGKRKGLADFTGYMSSSSVMLTAEEIVNVAAYIGSLPP